MPWDKIYIVERPRRAYYEHKISRLPFLNFLYRGFLIRPSATVSAVVIAIGCSAMMFRTDRVEELYETKINNNRDHTVELHYRDGQIPPDPRLKRWRFANAYRSTPPGPDVTPL